MSGFKLSGMDKLEKALKRGTDLNDIKRVVKGNGAELQTNAQRQASVDTGFMKRSITIGIEDSGMTAKIVSTAEYSSYVNYGTRFQTANPFMTNSYNKQRPKFKKDLDRLLK